MCSWPAPPARSTFRHHYQIFGDTTLVLMIKGGVEDCGSRNRAEEDQNDNRSNRDQDNCCCFATAQAMSSRNGENVENDLIDQDAKTNKGAHYRDQAQDTADQG